jgi:Flp pilus assembly protein TadG
MKVYSTKRQDGIVALVVALTLPVLLVFAGLALDFGHVFVNKTRLQNALDATALSAAITLNADRERRAAPATAQGRATIAGRATFDNFKASLGNEELATLSSGGLGFEYFFSLQPPIAADSTHPPAMVKVTSSNSLLVTPILIRIFNAFSTDIAVNAASTAGAVGQNKNLVPLVLCAGTSNALVDTNCTDDGFCYGYTTNPPDTTMSLNSPVLAPTPIPCTAGTCSFTVLQTITGDPQSLQGATDVGSMNGTLSVLTGVMPATVASDLNTRFSSDSDSVSPDYSTYKITGTGNGKRIMAVPVAQCLNSATPLILQVGVTCVFLRSLPITTTNIPIQITGEFCLQNGDLDPGNPVLNGSYQIVLLKSP